MQRLEQNNLGKIPLFSKAQKQNLHQSFYNTGAEIINKDPTLLDQYHRLLYEKELYSDNRSDFDALRTIFIFKVAFDSLKPGEIYLSYYRLRNLSDPSLVGFPNNSQFRTVDSLKFILASYISCYPERFPTVPKKVMQEMMEMTHEIENFVLVNPQPGFNLIMEGKILDFLSSLSEKKKISPKISILKRPHDTNEESRADSNEQESETSHANPDHASEMTANTNPRLPDDQRINDFMGKIVNERERALEEADSDSLKAYIIENGTIEQFQAIVNCDSHIALILAKSKKIREFIAKNATFDDFIEMIKKNRYLGLFLAGDKEICKLVNDPKMITTIMEMDREIANQIIRNNRDLQEIIAIQELPTKLPSLFGHLKKLTKTELELLNKKIFSGLQRTEVYCDEVLRCLGLEFLEKYSKISSSNSINLKKNPEGPIFCIEIGKLVLANFHGSLVECPIGVGRLATQILELKCMRQSIYTKTTSEDYFQKATEANQTKLPKSIKSVFPQSNQISVWKRICLYLLKVCETLTTDDFEEYEKYHGYQEKVDYFRDPNQFVQAVVFAISELNKINLKLLQEQRPSLNL